MEHKRGKTAREFVEQSEIMYADEKRATRLLNVMGFARPMAMKQSGYMGNIIRSKKSVKLKGVPFSDVFEETKTGPFALRAPVEETKDLIAVHNATEDNIKGLLDLKGFPMPSIAIIKAAHGHNDYGPYSFVFDKDYTIRHFRPTEEPCNPPDNDLNQEIINRGYEFVAHTHTDGGPLVASPADRHTLRLLHQESSTIIGIDGQEITFYAN